MNLANRLTRIEKRLKPGKETPESEWDMSTLSKEELLRILDLIDKPELTPEEDTELGDILKKCRRQT